MLGNTDQNHHQDTRCTKFHQEDPYSYFGPLGVLGVLVLRFSGLLFQPFTAAAFPQR